MEIALLLLIAQWLVFEIWGYRDMVKYGIVAALGKVRRVIKKIF